ncbi:unnamed protein product [Pieris macdunnoughi]|uniref:MADF domain-containing protein n=1 Tax=Pieris macdunnoughi TaxID=345717 RepID=A0A821U2W7_9NEOP|nr:unnamed protein product [Pieris macdunnoughi]
MTEYDVDFLISLIEERPILWDTSNEDYKNKFIKHDAWKDVCKSLFPNFEEKENNEKTKLGNSVIQKWRGIKDTFNKYENKLKDASRSGSGSKNIKEYHLYKQLQFLKKKFQNQTTTSINESENEQDNQEGTSKTRYQRQPPKRKMVNNKFEDDIVKILEEPENRHISFFKGILPSLELLDDNKSLIFQSRVLQILTELHQPHGYYYPNSNDLDILRHFATSQQTPLIRPQSSNVTDPSDTGDIIDVPATETQYTPRPPEPTRLKKRKRKLQPCIQPKAENIDEDRHFLMSLIPTFRKMSDNEKLTAKVEILKVIQQVRSSNAGIEFRSADVFIEEGTEEGSGGVKLELLSEGQSEPSYSDTDDDEDLSS